MTDKIVAPFTATQAAALNRYQEDEEKSMNKTTKKLVGALRNAGASRAMIHKAEAGQYDDYLSDSATPIMDLVVAARVEGLTQIADRAINGDFDATTEESDAWAASEDGQATFRELLGGSPEA